MAKSIDITITQKDLLMLTELARILPVSLLTFSGRDADEMLAVIYKVKSLTSSLTEGDNYSVNVVS